MSSRTLKVACVVALALAGAVVMFALLARGGRDRAVLQPPAGSRTEALGAGARGPLKAIWGPVSLPDGTSAFGLYRQLGVQVFQMQLRWEHVAAQRRPAAPRDPHDPAYSWGTSTDEAIARAGEIGAEVALLVTGTPRWANRGRDPRWVPDRAADFAEFVAAASRRYPTVRIWMIWGEPNRPDRFQPAGSTAPRRYAQLLDGAYGALKAVDPRDIVVGGMTYAAGAPTPAQFLQRLTLDDGRPPRLDWYGHNPYPYRLPDLANEPVPGGFRDLSDLDTLTREVRAHWAADGRAPRLWLSEFTVQTDRRSLVFAKSVSPAEQVAWLTAGYRAAREAGSVAGLGWFSLIDQQPETVSSSHWGLLTTALQRKPSFRAYGLVGQGTR